MDCFQEGELVGQPPPHAPNHLKDGSRSQEDNLQSSQDYSWMVNKELLVPRGQMRQAQTRLLSWPAQAPSHLTIAGGQLAIATSRTTHGWWGPACPGNRKILGPDETLEGQPVTGSTWERPALHVCLRAWWPDWCSGHAFLCEPISVTLHDLQGFASFWVWWSYIYYYTPHTHKSIYFLKGNCPRNPNMPSEKA